MLQYRNKPMLTVRVDSEVRVFHVFAPRPLGVLKVSISPPTFLNISCLVSFDFSEELISARISSRELLYRTRRLCSKSRLASSSSSCSRTISAPFLGIVSAISRTAFAPASCVTLDCGPLHRLSGVVGMIAQLDRILHGLREWIPRHTQIPSFSNNFLIIEEEIF